MSYQSKPAADGVYHIKVLNENLFIESAPGQNPGMKLVSPSPSSNKQKWKLAQVPGESNVWTMTSVEDQAGVTYLKTDQTYWGYGYPYTKQGPSQKWSILERTSEGQSFSKIKLSGSLDCFDSCDPKSNAVHFYYDHSDLSDGPKQCYEFELVPDAIINSLDVLFLQDFTGSQQQYIDAARNEIGQICNNLLGAGKFAPSDLRFGLVAFRDHPPQDNSFVTKFFDFTSDPDVMSSNLASLSATGGGDGPEAQSDALYEALNAPWNPKATKVAVLITDAPPHGTGESGDGFPKGCPSQHNPLHLAKRLAAMHVTLDVVACEPTLSNYYKDARNFYEGLAGKTGGRVINLGDPGALTNLITGSALEAVDSDALVLQHYAAIRSQAQGNSNANAVSRNLHSELSAANVHHHTLNVDNMYNLTEQDKRNAQIWLESETLDEAKAKIHLLSGNRIKEQYLSNDTLVTSVEKKPINLEQAQRIVQKSLVREF
ncbi:hypothetical protein BDV93DRAFT_563621 [Ceratobasidium sp. AG-I]|nr:hypothetical protein BDV93DRAFT_563621 [Ceratobasidium sp. AG-I]